MEQDSPKPEPRPMTTKRRAKLAKEILRLQNEREKLSQELMRDHAGKDAGWVRTRLNRIDWLSKQIAIETAKRQ